MGDLHEYKWINISSPTSGIYNNSINCVGFKFEGRVTKEELLKYAVIGFDEAVEIDSQRHAINTNDGQMSGLSADFGALFQEEIISHIDCEIFCSIIANKNSIRK